MQKRVAVVFDSAGTLLNMYRVAKDMKSGSILEDIQSTLLVAKRPNRALVVLRTHFEEFLLSEPDMGLNEFIDVNKILLGISCSSSPFEIEAVYDIIKKDIIKVSDLKGVISLVKARCPHIYYLASGIIVDIQEYKVIYVLSTGGQIYSSTPRTIRHLQDIGADIYIASGDDMHNLEKLAISLSVPLECVYPVASTHDKEHIVKELKKDHDVVFMVGDGMNDILALRAADVSILSSQQGDERPDILIDAADVVVYNILDVVEIVKEWAL